MIILEINLTPALSFGPLLINGTYTNEDLNQLIKKFESIKAMGNRHTHRFGIDNYSKLDAVQNFANVIEPYLSEEKLHLLIQQLIPLEGEHTRTRPTLLKSLLSLEAKNQNLFSLEMQIAFQTLVQTLKPNTNTMFAGNTMAALTLPEDKLAELIKTVKIPDAILDHYCNPAFIDILKKLFNTSDNDAFQNNNFVNQLVDNLIFNAIMPIIQASAPTPIKEKEYQLVLQALKGNQKFKDVCIKQLQQYHNNQNKLMLQQTTTRDISELKQTLIQAREKYGDMRGINNQTEEQSDKILNKISQLSEKLKTDKKIDKNQTENIDNCLAELKRVLANPGVIVFSEFRDALVLTHYANLLTTLATQTKNTPLINMANGIQTDVLKLGEDLVTLIIPLTSPKSEL